jgi:hypothetical protein
VDETEDRRASLIRARDAIKELADDMESERDGAPKDMGDWEETSGALGEDEMAAVPSQVTVTPQVTEEATGEVAKLWEGVAAAEEAPGADREDLRLDSLKRKYNNAIGRLPYGIPSKELEDWYWVDLSTALATGEKKTVEGDREVTMIDGRWYYSDTDDTSTFLMEHGAKPKEEPTHRRQGEADGQAGGALHPGRDIRGIVQAADEEVRWPGVAVKYRDPPSC